MPDDPRNLRPIELAQLINSTPAGEVVDDRDLRYIRTIAGVQTVSTKDSNRVDVIKYTSWLEAARHQNKKTAQSSTRSATSLNTEYEAIKERARARGSSVSKSGRDIGEIPPIKNMRRRRKAIRSFKYFCECYFPETFNLPWSKDHLKVIAKIEEVVKNGGLFSLAMSRGSGKTTIIERATIYSKIIGARPFTAVIGASEGHATMMLDSVKTEFETNDLLLEDFPEICYPIQCLDGINQRAAGQLHLGQRTRIEWTQKHIVLPTIPGSKASGSIIMVAGITGRIRGMKMTRADGSTIRPSLVLIDDPQTDESAKSPPQCAERERILAGAILGLAGPAKKIAGLMTVTVIRPDDMAERILDREKHPEWQGERMKMLYSLPSNETLWDQYAQLRAEGLKSGAGITEATAFYKKNRKAMDEGAEVAWKDRYNEDELSAIQHAMNLKFRDEAAFWAEYQNEPLPEFDDNEDLLSSDEIAAKTNGLETVS